MPYYFYVTFEAVTNTPDRDDRVDSHFGGSYSPNRRVRDIKEVDFRPSGYDNDGYGGSLRLTYTFRHESRAEYIRDCLEGGGMQFMGEPVTVEVERA